jgi:NAD(P)-dependent dehydrogenase (short-subunit alcohol dehydrogenase family)
MKGKTVVVTGASTGIGRECALLLASRGFRVFAGVRTEEAAQDLKRSAGEGLSALILDVTDGQSIHSAAQTVAIECGAAGLHGLVNNAGISVAGPLELLPIAALRNQLEVNVLGQVAVTQAFLPLLRAARGRIILMGSILGRFALPFLGAYAGAKFALEGIADSLGMELHDCGVSVTILEPGNIKTPIWEKSKRLAQDISNGQAGPRWDPYRGAAASFQEYTDRSAHSGIPAVRVARVVARALSARAPRTRYAVGWESRLLGRLAPALPGRLRRWFIRRVVLRR